jgi:hypothetical protein
VGVRRAPPEVKLLGGLEMTWPVLLSLKQSCVDLLTVMCRTQGRHSGAEPVRISAIGASPGEWQQ